MTNTAQLQAGLNALQEYLQEMDKLDPIAEGIIGTLFTALNDVYHGTETESEKE